MSAATATALCVSPRFPNKSPKPMSFLRLARLKMPVLAGGFVSGSLGLGRRCAPVTVNVHGLIRADALGGGGNGGAEVEAVLEDGSMEVRGGLAAGRLESTLNGLSKFMVGGLFGMVLIWRRDPPSMWAVIGTIFNTWISVTLKRIFNQERPVSYLKSDPGMPSSHAQSLFYGAVYLILSLVDWLGINAFTVTAETVILACASYLTWLRVLELFHTTNQVVAGAFVGTIYAILWFWLWQAFISNAFISFLWVRIPVVLCSIFFALSYVTYIIQHWRTKANDQYE